MTTKVSSNFVNALQKFGVAGFAFFLIKGILWLVAPFLVAWIL